MTSQAVVIDGSIYLIDAGYGKLMRLAELEMPLKKLKQVFITHQHADHIMDLTALMATAWSEGVANEIKVFGPHPMEPVIDGAIGTYKQDYEIRGKGGRFKPIHEVFVPKNLQSKNGEIFTIYEDELLKVSAIDVPHTVAPLAFAFRFDSKDRSIVPFKFFICVCLKTAAPSDERSHVRIVEIILFFKGFAQESTVGHQHIREYFHGIFSVPVALPLAGELCKGHGLQAFLHHPADGRIVC